MRHRFLKSLPCALAAGCMVALPMTTYAAGVPGGPTWNPAGLTGTFSTMGETVGSPAGFARFWSLASGGLGDVLVANEAAVELGPGAVMAMRVGSVIPWAGIAISAATLITAGVAVGVVWELWTALGCGRDSGGLYCGDGFSVAPTTNYVMVGMVDPFPIFSNPDPILVCKAYLTTRQTAYQNAYPGYAVTMIFTSMNIENTQCIFQQGIIGPLLNSVTQQFVDVTKETGTTCNSPGVYNTSTHLCDQPKVYLTPQQVSDKIKNEGDKTKAKVVAQEIAEVHQVQLPLQGPIEFPYDSPRTMDMPEKVTTVHNPNPAPGQPTDTYTRTQEHYTCVETYPTYSCNSTTTTTNPDGTTTSAPTASKNCGVYGETLACQIDDSGVPEPQVVELKDLDDAEKNHKDKVTEAVGATGKFSPSNLIAAPPFAQCSPIHVGPMNLDLDPCKLVNEGRAIVGYIWAMTAAWMCMGMIRKTMAGG